MDPSVYSPSELAWLRAQTGLQPEDLEEFKGKPAFQCEGKLFWSVPPFPAQPNAADLRHKLAFSLPPDALANLSSMGAVVKRSIGYAQVSSEESQTVSGLVVLSYQHGGEGA